VIPLDLDGLLESARRSHLSCDFATLVIGIGAFALLQVRWLSRC